MAGAVLKSISAMPIAAVIFLPGNRLNWRSHLAESVPQRLYTSSKLNGSEEPLIEVLTLDVWAELLANAKDKPAADLIKCLRYSSTGLATLLLPAKFFNYRNNYELSKKSVYEGLRLV